MRRIALKLSLGLVTAFGAGLLVTPTPAAARTGCLYSSCMSICMDNSGEFYACHDQCMVCGADET